MRNRVVQHLPRILALVEAGERPTDIARDMGLPQSSVTMLLYRHRKKNGLPSSRHRMDPYVKDFLKLKAEGLSYRQIAFKYGFAVASVRDACHRAWRK